MKPPENRTVLALLAHPDDAEFLCAGTLIRLAEAGWQVHIATVTPGDCGTVSETPWAIGGRRTEEARQAAARIGATYHCLGERDGFVVYDKTAIQKTLDLFRRVTPSLVFAHPEKDYMMDHEQSSLLARAASFLYAAPNCSSFPVQPGAGVPWLYYCDPVDGVDPLGHLVEPTTVIDVSDQLEAKAAMLACHASQREWLLAHHGIDDYIESMRRRVGKRGAQYGVAAAEVFVQHRGHAYPADDLLAAMFGGLRDEG